MDSIRTVGRYRIDDWLASGAMGEIYRGWDPVIDRPVAIKIVRPELVKRATSQEWLERFRREARAAGRRFHPNIIAVLDFGEEGGRPFLVMELVDGSSLDVLLKASGRLASQRAVAIVLQVLSALGFSHENGVIHRDIKPSNVLVRPNDQVKVADFGIARIDASELTIVGDILGTPAYMAPEQLAGAPVDHRTDLFAAGVMLFETLTCIKPFRGRSITEIIKQMETRGPEDVCALNPGVPSALRGVINTALSFDPDRRFATAVAFAHAVAQAVSPQEETATVIGTVAAKPVAEPRASAPGWDVETLRTVENDLAISIGPVAAVAVRRAAKAAKGLLDLYETLALYIDDQRDRADFLAKGRRADTAKSGPSSSPRPEKPATDTRAQARQDTLPDAAELDRIEAKLAHHIGPIARILVKQQLQRFESLPKLYDALARHISDEAERAAFLKAGGYD